MANWLRDEAAARWVSFPVDAEPRPLVLLQDRVRIEGRFIGGGSKIAWLEGAIEAASPVPPAVLSMLPTRREGASEPC